MSRPSFKRTLTFFGFFAILREDSLNLGNKVGYAADYTVNSAVAGCTELKHFNVAVTLYYDKSLRIYRDACAASACKYFLGSFCGQV